MTRDCREINDVVEAVRSLEFVSVAGAGSKSALSRGATISTQNLRGVLQYEPSEYTFTAMAGTPLADIQTMLGEHGQFLPFDPPLVEAGGTLGGTVAAGLSGPGRMRFGGVRDFLLGVKLVTGEGRVVFGGGKVVKNAAGFDIPKLMVGSLGRFGVLVELTFKVFPRPESYVTLRIPRSDLASSREAMARIAGSAQEPACLDFEPPNILWLRLGGMSSASAKRIDCARSLVGGDIEVLEGDEDARNWSAAREFKWVPDEHTLYKIPTTPSILPKFESELTQTGAAIPRRYSVAGNVAWLAWPDGRPSIELEEVLAAIDRPAVAIRGNAQPTACGVQTANQFEDRLLEVFDPTGKFAARDSVRP
jgi:glycolate oxidase FAD binding subunit